MPNSDRDADDTTKPANGAGGNDERRLACWVGRLLAILWLQSLDKQRDPTEDA